MMDNFLDSAPSTESTGEVGSAAPQINEFVSSLPEELRGETSLSKFNDSGSLAKSYVNLEKMVGGSIRLPNEKTTAEEKAEFIRKLEGAGMVPFDIKNQDTVEALLQKLGKPGAADGYKFDELKDKIKNEELLKEFSGVSHKLGLTNTQANELVKFQIEKENSVLESLNKSVETGVNTLKKEWGGAFEANLNQAKSVFQHYEQKFPEDAQILKQIAGTSPLLLRMLSDMAKVSKEGTHIEGQGENRFNDTAETARTKLAAIKADTKHAFWHERHPGHSEAMREFDELHKLLATAGK